MVAQGVPCDGAEFVEYPGHGEQRWAGVEGVSGFGDGVEFATNAFVFFDDGDVAPTGCEVNGGGESP